MNLEAIFVFIRETTTTQEQRPWCCGVANGTTAEEGAKHMERVPVGSAGHTLSEQSSARWE
jgi:hypothetical protein